MSGPERTPKLFTSPSREEMFKHVMQTYIDIIKNWCTIKALGLTMPVSVKRKGQPLKASCLDMYFGNWIWIAISSASNAKTI